MTNFIVLLNMILFYQKYEQTVKLTFIVSQLSYLKIIIMSYMQVYVFVQFSLHAKNYNSNR